MLFFTLNMWGLFEIPLPASLAKVGLTGPSEGLAGHLATGFFATLMATPCSAPFLGTALGFALTQDSGTTAAMFGAIGTGMASPYLLLAAFPAAGRVLPKPGAWMATFKVVMGFLLAATLVWLLFVLSGLVPAARVAFFEVGLLAVALAVWLGSRRGSGRTGAPGRRSRGGRPRCDRRHDGGAGSRRGRVTGTRRRAGGPADRVGAVRPRPGRGVVRRGAATCSST